MVRFRLFSPLLAVIVTLLSTAPASATSEGHSYLALGDSVAFGTSLCAPRDPNRCVGYPEHAAQTLNIEDVNASCPGEASGGFISLTGTDNVCRPYRAAYPLHVRYSTSQLDFAVSFLRNNPRTRLVTIDIGANDLFALQKTCARTPDLNTCLAQGFPRLLQDLASNLSVIYGAIRSTGYSGLLIGVTYYLTNYTDPVAVLFIGAINQVVESVTRAFGGFVADGFAAFQRVAARFGGNAFLAGLVIPGDIHPTAAGQALLAQTVVNTIRSTCPAASARGCLDQSPRSTAKPG
jgi:lysophospholipase L1-like esterase